MKPFEYVRVGPWVLHPTPFPWYWEKILILALKNVEFLAGCQFVHRHSRYKIKVNRAEQASEREPQVLLGESPELGLEGWSSCPVEWQVERVKETGRACLKAQAFEYTWILGTKVKKGLFSIRIRFLVSGYKTVMYTSMFCLEIQAGHQRMKDQKILNSWTRGQSSNRILEASLFAVFLVRHYMTEILKLNE